MFTKFGGVQKIEVANSGNISLPAVSLPATVIVPPENNAHVVYGVAWSYNKDVGGSGNLSIQIPSGTKVFEVDIVNGGPGFFNFDKGITGQPNQELFVKLGAVNSVTGKLSVYSRGQE